MNILSIIQESEFINSCNSHYNSATRILLFLSFYRQGNEYREIKALVQTTHVVCSGVVVMSWVRLGLLVTPAIYRSHHGKSALVFRASVISLARLSSYVTGQVSGLEGFMYTEGVALSMVPLCGCQYFSCYCFQLTSQCAHS
jgi:hypothetical protein